MALITLAAAKGAPGVTTTALVMGALWPRQVVVAECDSSGADIPLRMPGDDGGVLDPDRGLLSLAAAGRKGLRSDLVLDHTQRVIGGTEVLAGARMAEQAAGMTNIWAMLGPALDGLPGYDVLADAGRIGATTPQNVLLRASRLVILVCTVEPSSVIHTRERLNMLAGQLDPSSPVGTPIAVAIVAEPKARRAVAEVRESFERIEAPLHGLWHLAFDPKGAGFFKGQVAGRADKTMLVRTARPMVAEAAAIVESFFEPIDDTSKTADEVDAAWQDFSFAPDPSASGTASERPGAGADPGARTTQPSSAQRERQS